MIDVAQNQATGWDKTLGETEIGKMALDKICPITLYSLTRVLKLFTLSAK